MNDKIKELSIQRSRAMIEKYKALFVKQNADADYLEKTNTFDKIDGQLKQAIREEAEK